MRLFNGKFTLSFKDQNGQEYKIQSEVEELETGSHQHFYRDRVDTIEDDKKIDKVKLNQPEDSKPTPED